MASWIFLVIIVCNYLYIWLQFFLTHWGRVTHICVSKLAIIGSDNGLPPDRRQAIIWTNAGIWLIRTLGTNFSEILGEIHSFSFKKMHLKMSSAKGRLFSLGLNVLIRTAYKCFLQYVLLLLISKMIFNLPSSLYYKTHQIPILKRFLYRLAAFFAESLEARCQVENEDVVGAAPTGDAPTTSECSTFLIAY